MGGRAKLGSWAGRPWRQGGKEEARGQVARRVKGVGRAEGRAELRKGRGGEERLPSLLLNVSPLAPTRTSIPGTPAGPA